MAKSLADKINESKHGGAKVASRGNVTWCDPEDTTIVTDPADPRYGDFYDERVEWPLSEERMADLVLNGQINPVKVMVDGDQIITIGGKRRNLHLREINRRFAKGLDYDAESGAWAKKSGPPRSPLQLRIEQIPPGLSVGEIQRIILAENTNEPETKRSLALKIQRYSKHSSPAQLRASMNGMSKVTFDGLVAYVDLSAAAQRAVDEGRLKIANIPDIARHAKADQPQAIEALPKEATKVEEIRDALDNHREGKPAAEPRERKKVWGRKELAAYSEVLLESVPENKIQQNALALIALFQGDTRAFKKAADPWLITALEVMDKDGEKRRKKARERDAAKKQKKGLKVVA